MKLLILSVTALPLLVLLSNTACFKKSSAPVDSDVDQTTKLLDGTVEAVKQAVQPHLDAATLNPKELRTALAAFRKASSAGDKYKAAANLTIYAAFLPHETNKSILVSLKPEEQQLIARASAFMIEEQALLTRLGNSLTVEDVRSVTQDNPEPLFRDKYLPLVAPTSKCSREEYERVRDAIGLRELQKNAMNVAMINSISEDAYREKYRARLITLIENEPRLREFLSLRETLLSPPSNAPKNGIVDRIQQLGAGDVERLAAAEKALGDAGIAKRKLFEYRQRLAQLAPHCLTELNLQFYKMMQLEVTLKRGQAFIGENSQAGFGGAPLPKQIREVPVDESDPLLGSTSDVWGNPYILQPKGIAGS